MMMEAAHSSKMSEQLLQTTWCHIPQNSIPQSLSTEHKIYLLKVGDILPKQTNKKKKTKKTNKLHGLSLRANYTERPLLVGEVIANFCG
jgi:hypothetical protein